MTQIEKVLRHLKEGKTITSFEALKEYEILRLSAVIYVLRNKGYRIDNLNPKNMFAIYILIN
ncbi:helix-turn-helix domain-containing protein [Francisella philomiragia]|uniref:Winged helix-turn-helix domain-containing protein n=1 Tax=Francisella philomiragia TaxID=28110 RepID=A0ABS1GD56_9GAMM|nr:helix-turn-helix domain-containing protein [Francisella philomiragia]MBK2259183.1 hypothetical protein [Francisella philomiragia]MBK2302780.1 hypothetical protein [Francisella philomiragia]